MTRPPRAPDEQGQRREARIDPDTGELLEPNATAAPEDNTVSPAHHEPADTISGERSLPSVNRERSIRSRLGTLLLFGTLGLLTLAFFVWYYGAQFAQADQAEQDARKAQQDRAAGEMKLAPLGRIDPPPRPAAQASAAAASDLLGPAPPAPPTQPTASTGHQPPPKTAAQLALERKLGEPVLLRNRTAAVAAAGQAAGGVTALPQVPNLTSILGGLAGSGTASGNAQPQAGGLEAMLRPTVTQAVAAQVLPTRRWLVPKGAFIDCTLETAIDSTFDGLVTCIGASDIYSADGKVVLLERGTKYVGEKRGEPRQGQGRVFVLWHEARTPTGVVAQLASPGTDELGRTGLPGHVDTHFWDRFGAAILVSVIDGTLQAIAATQQGGSGSTGGDKTTVVLNPQGTRDVMTEVLKSTISIPPTVIKHQGDRIQILAARDVDFRAVYALRGNE